MRRSPLFLLVPFAAVLSACGGDNGTAPTKALKIFDCANGSRYEIGQTVSGSIGNGDCTDPSGTGRADYYQFTLASAGPVSIKVENTSAASPRLINAILTPAGDVTHFRLTSLTGSATVGGNLAAGTYVVVVAASEDNQTSSYTLTSSAVLPAVFDCHAIGTLTIGTGVVGSFAPTDCADPDGFAPADYYSFTLTAPQAITLKLTPSGGNSIIVGIGDDSGDIWDADFPAIGVPATVTVNLPAGRFYAIAAATNESQTGSYTLESSTNALSAQNSSASSPKPAAAWTSRRRW